MMELGRGRSRGVDNTLIRGSSNADYLTARIARDRNRCADSNSKRAVQPYEYAIALARWLARLQIEFSGTSQTPNGVVKSKAIEEVLSDAVEATTSPPRSHTLPL
jgi:hypothetical protein